MRSDARALRLVVEFEADADLAMLVWALRRIIDALHSSPVPLRVRFERVDAPE